MQIRARGAGRRRAGDDPDLVAGDAVPVDARQPPRRRRGPPLHVGCYSLSCWDAVARLLRAIASGLFRSCSSALYFDGHLAMMPSGMTASWLSAVSVPLADHLGAALERVGDQARVGRGDDRGRARRAALDLEPIEQRSLRLLDRSVDDVAVDLQLACRATRRRSPSPRRRACSTRLPWMIEAVSSQRDRAADDDDGGDDLDRRPCETAGAGVAAWSLMGRKRSAL